MSKEWFDFTREIIEWEIAKQDGYALFEKATKIINHVWQNFSDMLWGEMAELKYKLSWYKYYLSWFLWELQRTASFYHLEIKKVRATEWDKVSSEIKAVKGKVATKDEIENQINILVEELKYNEVVYENLFYQYKIKLSAIDDIITCMTQRLSELKRQMEIWA